MGEEKTNEKCRLMHPAANESYCSMAYMQDHWPAGDNIKLCSVRSGDAFNLWWKLKTSLLVPHLLCDSNYCMSTVNYWMNLASLFIYLWWWQPGVFVVSHTIHGRLTTLSSCDRVHVDRIMNNLGALCILVALKIKP